VKAVSNGRKTLNAVPLHPLRSVLRKRIEPPYFWIMPRQTHNPSPVPLSPFVVKKGSKIRCRFSDEIPDPVSAITVRTPGRAATFHS